MKTLKRKPAINLKSIALMAVIAIFAVSCSEDEIKSAGHDVAFEATDAPIDNAEVKAVFVTISEIWVDGNKVEGFNKTTLELSALTEGKTQLLKQANIDASSASEITFVLDYDLDDEGQAPGSYVLKLNGSKDKISSASNKIDIKKRVDFAANATTTIVADFDLRQLIKESSGDYELVTEAEMESSIRVVAKSGTGVVQGSVSKADTVGSKSIAFLYKRGEFDAKTELMGSGESNIQFANAVTSAKVNGDGSFRLSFIEEGEYEVHIFRFEDKDNDGKLEVTGRATLISNNTIQLDSITISANSTTELDATVVSFLTL